MNMKSKRHTLQCINNPHLPCTDLVHLQNFVYVILGTYVKSHKSFGKKFGNVCFIALLIVHQLKIYQIRMFGYFPLTFGCWQSFLIWSINVFEIRYPSLATIFRNFSLSDGIEYCSSQNKNKNTKMMHSWVWFKKWDITIPTNASCLYNIVGHSTEMKARVSKVWRVHCKKSFVPYANAWPNSSH